MPTVLLGNHAAHIAGRPYEGRQVTLVVIPDSDTHSEGFQTIAHDDGIWPQVAREPAAWVACDDERMARRLAAWFGCPVITMDAARQLRAEALVAGGHVAEVSDQEIADLLGPGDGPSEVGGLR